MSDIELRHGLASIFLSVILAAWTAFLPPLLTVAAVVGAVFFAVMGGLSLLGYGDGE